MAAGESTVSGRPNFGFPEVAPVAARFGASFELAGTLPSERDQNFLLSAGPVQKAAVLKVHNPSDDLAFVEMQNAALERAAAAGANCQRLLLTAEGETVVPLLPEGQAAPSLCRCLSFLPGRMLAEAAAEAASPEERAALWEEVGGAVGGVSAALLGFGHPAAHKEFAWDLQRCEEVIAARAADVAAERRPLLDGFLEGYRRLVVPLLPRLRTSVAHNDPNDYNLVVGADGRVGVLDFGDMIHTYTCADPAICMAYLLFHCPEDAPLAESVVPFVRRFHEKCPLDEAELDALFGLAVMRVCTSVCMSAYQSKLEPDNEYLLISAKPAWALLERLALESAEEGAPALLRQACGLPPPGQRG